MSRPTLPSAATLAFGLALAAISGPARADGARAAVAWRAPAGCGDGSSIVAEVERLVAGSPSAERVEAEADVTRDEGVVRVRLRTRARGAAGDRVVEAATCGQVASATAVILALMIDPGAAARVTEEAAGPVTPVAPSPSAPPPAVVASPPPSAVGEPARDRAARAGASRPFHVVASASFAGDAGTMPGASGGGAVAVSALIGAYRVGLRGAFFPHASGSLAGRAGVGADFSMLVGGLEACRAVVDRPRARAELCAGAEVDRVSGDGFGVSAPSSGSTPFGAAALGALLDVPVASHLSAEVRAGAVVPFTRPPFYFEGLGTVHQPSPVAGRVSGGLAVHF